MLPSTYKNKEMVTTIVTDGLLLCYIFRLGLQTVENGVRCWPHLSSSLDDQADKNRFCQKVGLYCTSWTSPCTVKYWFPNKLQYLPTGYYKQMLTVVMHYTRKPDWLNFKASPEDLKVSINTTLLSPTGQLNLELITF